MMYRERPLTYRKYPDTYKGLDAESNLLPGDTLDDIPLPNEPADENVKAKRYKMRNGHKPSFLDIFRNGFDLDFEEIILIGVIILLLFEGGADEILLIMLAFILLTGRES